MLIQKKNEIIYSAIPYGIGRNYIQRAAILTLLYPESTIEYLKKHKPNLMKYIKESLKQKKKASCLAEQYYQEIFKFPLFTIQVLGRMLQHDETGPLSANLPGKFLYDINQKTGISEYIAEFLKFVIEITNILPIATDGENVYLLENFKNKELIDSIYGHTYISIYSKPNINILPENTQTEINKKLIVNDNYIINPSKPLLRSEVGPEISKVRRNYVAQGIPPSLLEHLFTNVLTTENENLINVVSDIHSLNKKIPFINNNFNILAGDISDSNVKDIEIKGIMVIGNHELSDMVNEKTEQMSEFDEYRGEYWFKKLVEKPDEAWAYLPTGDNSFYEVIKAKLSSNFPKMIILNNEDFHYENIRYIGLTLPVSLIKRKLESQQFICKTLKKLLASDPDTPTIIISHAPLFNELSMLSPKNNSYNPENYCTLDELYEIFKNSNIIGVIHGHHHIRASKGRGKVVDFAGKRIFVICSIYSKLNTGLELQPIINRFSEKKEN